MSEPDLESLTHLMNEIGYPNFDVLLGEDDIPMIYVDGRLMCSVAYALTQSEDQMKSLISDALQVG